MITGDDTVLISKEAVSGALARCLDELSQVWPDMRVSAKEPGPTDFRPWRAGNSVLPMDGVDVLIALDEPMLEFWDTDGYELRNDGMGPFAVLYSRAKWTELRADVLEDPYEHEGPGRFDPHDITLVGEGFFLVTVVTPSVESDFAQQIISMVKRHLAAPSRKSLRDILVGPTIRR